MKYLFELLPQSEVELAKAIGIGAKTIRRIRNGDRPSRLVRLKIKRYITQLIGKLQQGLEDEKTFGDMSPKVG